MTTSTPYIEEEIDQSAAPAPLMPEPEPTVINSAEIEFLCPFCGAFNDQVGKPCSHCQLEDNTSNRAATQQRLGPWYVLQATNPSAPGMNFETLQTLIQRQIVTSRSVVRGPTTGQLWRLASKIRGLSREFGQCYSCGGDIESTEINCPHCDRIQTVPEHIDSAPETAALARETAVVSPVAFEPESSEAVREALLAEPVVYVQLTSDPAEDRPVLAERSERHIPKDDLLTPRDVAKAFQLEFGFKPDPMRRPYYQPHSVARKMKIALSSAGALIALAMIFPMVHVVSGWINSNQAQASTRTTPLQSVAVAPIKPSSVAGETFALQQPAVVQQPVVEPTPVTVTSAATAADMVPVSIPETIVFTPKAAASVAPVTTVAAAPVAQVPAEIASAMANAAVTPLVTPEPAIAPSSEDDPTVLWNNGLTAESTGNFSAAVQAYERIESLPSYSWPAHLETRLELARKELKGETK